MQWAIIRLLIKTFSPEGIVIVGCGRSWTRFISKYLTQHGFRVGHENLRYKGISSWFLTAGDSKVPIGLEFSPISDLGFTIVHQVRESLAAIYSMQAFKDSRWHFMAKHMPVDRDSDSKVLMAMKYYFYRNRMAEKLTDKRVQVEHYKSEIASYNKRKPRSPGKDKTVSGKDQVNNREYSRLSWEDLEREETELTMKIRELAVSYNDACYTQVRIIPKLHDKIYP